MTKNEQVIAKLKRVHDVIEIARCFSHRPSLACIPYSTGPKL